VLDEAVACGLALNEAVASGLATVLD